MSGWTYLFIAGFLEIAFTTALKLSEGFTRYSYVPAFILLSIASFFCLGKATGNIPVGTAYAIWTGIGAAGTALVGIWIFKEPASPLRLFFLACIVISAAGLKFSEAPPISPLVRPSQSAE